MNMPSRFFNLTLRAVVLSILLALPQHAHPKQAQETPDLASPVNSQNYERITAHLRGVYGPRGYFNLVVGLYSYPLAGLYGAKFDIKPGLMVLDIAPGFPRVTVAQMHHIETISGYSPGPIEIEEIQPSKFAESGPGWRKIQPPKSRNVFVRWARQNFVNHHY